MGRLGNLVATLEKSCTTAPWLFDLYTWSYRWVVDREIQLAEIDSDDRLLNVGCGGMPFTAALIAEKTGATVYALDHDPDVVEEAQRNLERIGVADSVEIVVGDGREVIGDGSRLPERCSVAIVALQAEPKDAILTRQMQSDDGPGRIVVRQPRKIFAGDYDPVTVPKPTPAADGGSVPANIRSSQQCPAGDDPSPAEQFPSPTGVVSHLMLTFDRSILFRTE